MSGFYSKHGDLYSGCNGCLIASPSVNRPGFWFVSLHGYLQMIAGTYHFYAVVDDFGDLVRVP